MINQELVKKIKDLENEICQLKNEISSDNILLYEK